MIKPTQLISIPCTACIEPISFLLFSVFIQSSFVEFHFQAFSPSTQSYWVGSVLLFHSLAYPAITLFWLSWIRLFILSMYLNKSAMLSTSPKYESLSGLLKTSLSKLLSSDNCNTYFIPFK